MRIFKQEKINKLDLIYQILYKISKILQNKEMESNSRKDDIIIQIGAEWMRVGLVGDKVPRKTFRPKSIAKILTNKDNVAENEMIMEELLCNIFFVFLNSSCQNKTVIILEKVYTQRIILDLMANIMFKKLKIEKLELSLSCVTPLYLTGKYSGAVISSGASCTEIMPIYEGYPLFRNYQYIDGGSSRINKFIRDQLSLMNPDIDKDVIRQLTEQEISDIKNNFGSIPAENKDIFIPVKRNKLKFNPNKINFQLLFGDYNNQEPNIAYSFLKMLNQVSVDCLDRICQNIVFSGGLWRVKGMQNNFKKHVLQLLPEFPKLQHLQVKKKLSFVTWGFNPSEVSWIGCSIGASVKNIENLCLRKTQYQQKGKYIEKIMETYFNAG